MHLFLLCTHQTLAFVSLTEVKWSLSFSIRSTRPIRSASPSNPLHSYPAHLPCPQRCAQFCFCFQVLLHLLLRRPDCHPRVCVFARAALRTPYHLHSRPLRSTTAFNPLRRSTAGAPANGRPRVPSATFPSTDTRTIPRNFDNTSQHYKKTTYLLTPA